MQLKKSRIILNSGVARNFKRGGGGAITSTIFFSVFFGKTDLKLIEK